MPFAGGIFSRIRRWAGETNISQTEFDQADDDVATALSNCLLRDGTGLPTADIPWGGKKITGLGAPTNLGDAIPQGLLTSAETVRALGFTPVQQGTGPFQYPANTIKMGWSGTRLRAAVDATDLGAVWTDAAAALTAQAQGYFTLPSGMILQWGSAAVTTDGQGATAVGFTVTFPNAALRIVPVNGNHASGAILLNMLTSANGFPTKSNFGVRAWSPANNAWLANATIQVDWIAVGF